jgi:hypothetical protein
MSTTVLRDLASHLLAYQIVIKVEFLGTKIRAHLMQGYMLDVYYNQTTQKYSYTVFKKGIRILGWDNAKHHTKLETFPHHYHSPSGGIVSSQLRGMPIKDLKTVMDTIARELKL